MNSLEQLNPTLDQDCYDWLELYRPSIIPRLEILAMDKTKTPGDVKRYIGQYLGMSSDKYATYCANALKHIRSQNVRD